MIMCDPLIRARTAAASPADSRGVSLQDHCQDQHQDHLSQGRSLQYLTVRQILLDHINRDDGDWNKNTKVKAETYAENRLG